MQLSMKAKVADIFTNLLSAQIINEALPKRDRYEQGKECRHPRTERDVLKYPRTRKVKPIKIFKQIVKHYLLIIVIC